MRVTLQRFRTLVRARGPGPALFLAGAWLIQGLRVLCGVDFSDEMQYYGEILGLATTGKLFTADRFLQEGVYVLFDPLFSAYLKVLGTQGLVLFGRIVLAGVILWMYGMVRRTLVRAGVGPVVAACCGLACTLAVPYHNIYALSYNTVSQVVVAVCFARFFLWRRDDRDPDAVFWSVACAVLFLVYPTLGVGIGALVAARLALEHDVRSLARFVLLGACLTVVTALVALRFSSPGALWEALAFSRSFGAGSLLSGGKQLRLLAAIPVIIMAGYVMLRSRIARLMGHRRGDLLRPGIMMAGLLLACGLAIGWGGHGRYWPSVPATALLVLISSQVALRSAATGSLSEWRWVTACFLIVGLVLAATSGNGLNQFTGAAMLAAPFYLALASRSGAWGPAGRASRFEILTLSAGMIAVFLILWLAWPYRDARLWRLSTSATDVPGYRLLRISPEKARALAMIRAILADIPATSRIMVVGGHPWIYFATDTLPETAMVYMHDGPARSMEIVARRIPGLRPDYLVLAGGLPDVVDRAIADLIHDGRYACDVRPIDEDVSRDLARQTRHDLLPSLTVCRRPGPSVGR